MTGTRNRVLVIVAVLVSSLWAINPPGEKITLGLDLAGGVHLVLRVQTDDALRLETQTTVERLRSALTESSISFAKLEAISPTEFSIEGVQDDAGFRRAAEDAATTFDRAASGRATVFRMKPRIATAIRHDTVEQALHTIERRVNELGVAEPVVARYGGADRILVQLPGVSDVERAKQIIKSTKQLRLTLVERGPFQSRDAALLAYNDSLPSELEILPGPSSGTETSGSVFYVVQRVPAVSGSDLRTARQSLDELNRPAVAFTLTQEAARRFGAITERNINRDLATVLDDRVMSVATILSRIDDQGRIAGVSREEMIEQVINLRSGALPADLEYVEDRTVGASLGEASIRAGVLASFGGLILVLLFMLAYYRLTGLNALVSIVLNLVILIALVAYIPVTLTLPGIAGLILTIGMGVDSNVLILERIKEELASGRTARAAVNAGFNRVWITIVDTHVTSLIAAAFLFQFGTSSIRGFATTLTIGLVANVFTAVFVSRTMFELILSRGRAATRTLSILGPAQLFTNASFNFSRWRWHAIILSLVVIGAGAAVIVTRGLPLGIDFSGGTLLVVEFGQQGVTEEDVRNAVARIPGDEVVQRYGPVSERQFLIRLPLAQEEVGDSLEAGARRVTEALQVSQLTDFKVVKRELVSAAIGADLQRRGIYATIASILAIAIYIGIRFRLFFAIGAIAATVHDILVTLACLSFAGYDLSLNVTAALLTIIGYSVNDTIVIFDRVRENLTRVRREPLDAVVNLSVNQTLSRTIMTASTTFLAVLSLYAFGGEALRGFAFTMLVGVVSGTYSTVFIASAIAIVSSGRKGVASATR